MMILLAVLLMLLAGVLLYIFAGGPKLPPGTDAIIDDVLNSQLPELITGQTGFASSGGLNIWYECISPQGTPRGTVLLLMGSGGNALLWPPGFVRAFVDAGYQLVRYDHRGTGVSDWVEDWDRRNPYSVVDMAGDVVAVLDALGIERAHLVGLSMGGMIAQEVAIGYPDRVASLTLMMTSGFIGDPHLPQGPTARYLFNSLLKGLPLLKYRLIGGEKNLIKEPIAKQRSISGYEGWDIREMAEVFLYDLRKRRGINIRGAFQHMAAVTVSGSRYEGLRTLDVPTLVIHGTADQFIPVEHGRQLAAVIPGAKGVWLEGVGHVFPVPDMDGLLKDILCHLN